MVAVQGRRSSTRSLFSCKANRYLGVQNSTDVNAKGSSAYPHVSTTGEQEPQKTAATRDVRADGERRRSDRRPFTGGGSVGRVTRSRLHTREHSDARLPDTPHL